MHRGREQDSPADHIVRGAYIDELFRKSCGTGDLRVKARLEVKEGRTGAEECRTQKTGTYEKEKEPFRHVKKTYETAPGLFPFGDISQADQL
jgi:hypothetical protein